MIRSEKTKSKRGAILLVLLALCLMFGTDALRFPTLGDGAGYGWYCVHAKNHVQPRAGGEISFVEELDGYYLDHAHAAPDSDDKVIYLTFDAGYENGNVAKILDVLKEKDVRAAFFVLGHLIKNDTALVERMMKEGHTVGNHTVRHKDMSAMNDEEFLAELRELEEICRETTGAELSHYYRPPEGRFSRRNLECAKANGYKTIFWSFAYPDWDNARQMAPEKAKQIVLDNLHNGEVMLLHPTSATNAAILGDVIDAARAAGYHFGTLDELTGAAG